MKPSVTLIIAQFAQILIFAVDVFLVYFHFISIPKF
jgi:hypothetical protein